MRLRFCSRRVRRRGRETDLLRVLSGPTATVGCIDRLKRIVLLAAVFTFVFAPAQLETARVTSPADVAVAMLVPTTDADGTLVGSAAPRGGSEKPALRATASLYALALAVFAALSAAGYWLLRSPERLPWRRALYVRAPGRAPPLSVA